MFDALETSIRQISMKGFWAEGLYAIRQIIKNYKNELNKEILGKTCTT